MSKRRPREGENLYAQHTTALTGIRLQESSSAGTPESVRSHTEGSFEARPNSGPGGSSTARGVTLFLPRATPSPRPCVSGRAGREAASRQCETCRRFRRRVSAPVWRRSQCGAATDSATRPGDRAVFVGAALSALRQCKAPTYPRGPNYSRAPHAASRKRKFATGSLRPPGRISQPEFRAL